MVTSPVADTETGFTAELGQRHADLFAAFYEHPFLAGMREGNLSKERVLHYLGQDHQYLSAYIRCYGLGLALSPNREWMRYFHDNIAFILEEEAHPHHVLCDYVGTSYEEAQVDQLAPSARAYIDHMMQAGRDTLGVLLASLLPCPWTYTWAADRFLRDAGQDGDPSKNNPFHGWWAFYADPQCLAITTKLRGMIDDLADDTGWAERERMERAFFLSCHHEIRFWQMAWSLEDWTPPESHRTQNTIVS
ncbi:TenA family protein [Salinactinospora qingdaonensis]|uniref:Thiaminase II n=1 Tax=Salinactinospora qingdaonensis TaxID=702744 RepID=A0ABP7GB34_9ACTN